VLSQVIHLAIGELTPRSAPAIGICDLRLMLQSRTSFWRPIASQPLNLRRLRALAKSADAERMVYAVFAFASRIFPSLAPGFESQQQAFAPGVRMALDFLVQRAFPPALINPSRLEMIWRKAMLLPPGSRRALFARQMPLRLRYHLGRLLGRFE
jgi:hypothetical protein